MSGLHVIVGAGPLGRGLARQLLRHGQRVRLISRSGGHTVDGAESMRVDATVSTDLDRALAGAVVVYQCSQPHYTRWAQEFPRLQQGILDATVRAGADLVLADNLYMYGDPEGRTITERSPQVPATKKGRVRKAMADAALEAHQDGRLRVAISRPSDYFGPGHDQTSKAVFGNAVRGKSMQFFGRMDQPHTLSYVPDAARAMALLGTSGNGWGQVWIPPVQPALTQGELAERVWEAAGQSGRPRVSLLGRGVIRAVGLVVPVVREFGEMYYEYEKPFVVDSTAFESAFGIAPTPLDDAIATTVAHYREEAQFTRHPLG